MTADVDGDGRPDVVRFHGPSGSSFRWMLQIEFGAGGFSSPLEVEMQRVLGVVDLDGDGSVELLVSNSGNTASAGLVVDGRTCKPRFVDAVTSSGRAPFTYLYRATGNACAPMCHATVQCLATAQGVVMEVTRASWADLVIGSTSIPDLSDDLRYSWHREQWRYDGDAMQLESEEEGIAAYGDLPVPKRQGVDC